MAGLPWIKVWTVSPDHPKVQRLEKELRLKDAFGVVVRLWCWTAKFQPDGDIPEADVLSAAKFARGDACRTALDAMVEAFVSVGQLDRIHGGYRVHDWHEMQTRHVEAEEKRKAQAAERQARLRERRASNAPVPVGVTRDVTRDEKRDVTVTSVTRLEGEGDKREKEIEKPPAGGLGRAGGKRNKVCLGPLGARLVYEVTTGMGKGSLAPLTDSCDATALESVVEAHGGVSEARAYLATTYQRRPDFEPRSVKLLLDVLRDPLPQEGTA